MIELPPPPDGMEWVWVGEGAPPETRTAGRRDVVASKSLRGSYGDGSRAHGRGLLWNVYLGTAVVELLIVLVILDLLHFL